MKSDIRELKLVVAQLEQFVIDQHPEAIQATESKSTTDYSNYQPEEQVPDLEEE